MAWPWQDLAPHRPVPAGGSSYVARPGGSIGTTVAQHLLTFRRPALITGPVGAGKSTELASATSTLQNNHAAFLVPIDQLAHSQKDQVAHLLLSLATMIVETTRQSLSLNFSEHAQEVLAALHAGFTGSPLDVVRLLVREVGRHRPTVIAVDGLEKLDDQVARDFLWSLLSLSPDSLILAVVSPGLVTGPQSFPIRDNFDVTCVRALPVWDLSETWARASHHFLEQVATTRLGMTSVPADLRKLLSGCAMASGGVVPDLPSIVAQGIRLRHHLWTRTSHRSRPRPRNCRVATEYFCRAGPRGPGGPEAGRPHQWPGDGGRSPDSSPRPGDSAGVRHRTGGCSSSPPALSAGVAQIR